MKNATSLLLIIVLVFCYSCSSTEKTKEATSTSFTEMLESYYQDGLKLFPFSATFEGDKRYNDLFINYLDDKVDKEVKGYYQNYLDQLKTFDRASLTPEQQISYDVLEWECTINLAEMGFPGSLMPIDQFWTLQLTIGQLASGASAQPFENKEDYDNWLKRLDGFVSWTEDAIKKMKEGIEKGYVLPKSLIEKVIPQLKGWSKGLTEEHHFYSPIHLLPKDISEDERDAITDSYKKMIEEKIIPAMSNLYNFMKDDYLASGRSSSGVGNFPEGKDWYQHRIKLFTTTEMTADEVFNLGKSEVARLRGEMEKVMKQVDYKGDLNSFFDHVRSKPELIPFTDPQQVIDNFNKIHEKMKPQLIKLFDKTPKTPFEVKRTEAFREASASAEYNPGSLDGTRPGVFYVPIPNVRNYNIYSDEDLFLHEAIPGHHYQISLTQENTELPSFRRTLWYSAYGEGWALYSESLGKELGLYEDPYQYFGMLGAEMHRAIRLVVDAGIHSKGWSREEAIQYSLENEAETEQSIISEIERYMAGPGQALSYKVGQLKIRELRKKAKEALKDKFDIRQFHNIVLESGCVPLKVLESKVDSWIQRMTS